jgi:hypothetical protein
MQIHFRIILCSLQVMLALLSPAMCFCQIHTSKSDSVDEYYSETFLRFEDQVYKKNIQSVQLSNKAADLSSAMLRFNSEDQLKLSFDDLDAGYKNYFYTVVNCNSDWKPSDLNFNEYVNGFTENPVTEYHYSSGIITRHYTHYNLYFPNENLIILKPGNYILKVYEDNNPDRLIITKRFMVYENDVSIVTQFKYGSALTNSLTRQGINFSIQYPGYEIRNPFELKVVLMQNNRWDNAITDLKPVFLRTEEATYDFSDAQNEFEGGSEFRNFDIKSIRYRSLYVDNIKTESEGVDVYLKPDEKRGTQRYSFAYDINGRYLVKIQEGTNSESDADYCTVHFFLPYASPETQGNVYVFGELTNWTCGRDNKLKYNYERNGYEGTLLVKQGYYNYQYVILSDGNPVADVSPIEGSHSETENEYTVLVYYRSPSAVYDRLIGVKKINSTKN